MNLASIYYTDPASTFAEGTDSVFMFITWVSLFFFVLIVGLMAIFIVKYRRKSEDEVTPNISHNLLLEIVWSIVPIILVLFMFYWGYKEYDKMTDPTAALEEADGKQVIDLYVTGKQWSWDIAYPHGLVVSSTSSKVKSLPKLDMKKFNTEDPISEDLNYMVLPVNRVIRLNMTSNDVIHSFAVPAFRVKKDVIRNRNSMLWFKATKVGTYIYTCNEMCGNDHSKMIGYLRVVSEEDYIKWVQRTSIDNRKPWEIGKSIYENTCAACHSLDGEKRLGPSWKDLVWGKKGHPIEGGTVDVDIDYITESVNKPNAKFALGYPNGGMGPQNLSPQKIQALIAFMKSPLKDPNLKTDKEEVK